MALNKEFPRTPPEVRSKYVYGKKLHAWFAAGSAALLVAVVAMVIQDYDREWKGYQRQFRAMKEARFEQEYSKAYYAAKTESDELKAKAVAAKAKLAEREAIVGEKRKALALLHAKDLYDATQQQKFAKAELDTALFHFEEARKKNSPDLPKVEKVYRGWVETLGAKVEILKEVTARVERAEDELGTDEAELRTLAKTLSAVVRKRDTAFQNWAKLQPSVANVVRDIPLLDFIDPKYKIQQRVIEDIRLDYYFAKVPLVDRCETCHQGITDGHWENEYQP
ncbi:MAG: hypothetical protein ACYS22_21070, partial [Planctomycetota bacterium]